MDRRCLRSYKNWGENGSHRPRHFRADVGSPDVPMDRQNSMHVNHNLHKRVYTCVSLKRNSITGGKIATTFETRRDREKNQNQIFCKLSALTSSEVMFVDYIRRKCQAPTENLPRRTIAHIAFSKINAIIAFNIENKNFNSPMN